MAKVSFVEQYLRHPDKLEALSPDKRKFFWLQRRWHPLIQMRWIDSIESDGKGTLTFPDGSKHFYNGQSQYPSG